jgi:hypothetical protein
MDVYVFPILGKFSGIISMDKFSLPSTFNFCPSGMWVFDLLKMF